MKRASFFFFILSSILIWISCEKDDAPKRTLSNNYPVVSEFIYDGMSTYYLWSNEMLDKRPPKDNTDPEEYFKSLLSDVDIRNQWSWITDDAEGLIAQFKGEPKSFGFSLSFRRDDEQKNRFYAIVKYVFPNTPAANANIQRLDIIGEVDGAPITGKEDDKGVLTLDNDKLFKNEAANISIFKLTEGRFVKDREVFLTPIKINADPVLYDNIYTIGNKKIGYLFYTNFTGEYNYRLFETFSKFKTEGVTELVLDLRYNPGGDISAATYLASLIAPKSEVEKKTVFTKLNFNEFLNSVWGDNSYRLGDFAESGNMGKPLEVNLDLKKVYIIATSGSASASELLTFCLRPIMGDKNVIHIGEKTSGKYAASNTIHPYDEEIGIPIYDKKKMSEEQISQLKNWAMQPIIAIYTNKDDKDFINPGHLEPDYALSEGFTYIDFWTEIGDPKDVLLGQALYLITADERYRPVPPPEIRSTQHQPNVVSGLNQFEKRAQRAVNLDFLPSQRPSVDEIKKLRENNK